MGGTYKNTTFLTSHEQTLSYGDIFHVSTRQKRELKAGMTVCITCLMMARRAAGAEMEG